MILAIDTSLGSAVAVVDLGGQVLGEASSPNALGHAEVIGTLIENALAAASIAPARITYVAAGMGPGPFTGLRIGIAAARAFALGRGVPVIAVASHDAAALAQLEGAATSVEGAAQVEDGGPCTIITDARRREVAISTYDGLDADGIPRRASGPALHLRDASHVALTEAIPAGALGRLAARGLAADRELATSEPLYLRAPDVTMPKGPKRVGT